LRVLIIPDSFKGSASSLEVAQAISAGFGVVRPQDERRILPVADGGEGTVTALVEGCGGSYQSCTVHGPLGAPTEAVFGLLADGTAIIEMAQASGLPLVPVDQRDPTQTSTYGTGELILRALDLGCRRIIMGIGGSATNDGGAGMACALGAKFLDKKGKSFLPVGGALAQLDAIDCTGLDPRLAHTQFLVASDVTNPLCGPTGASAVYGPQKGATPEQVVQLDAALARYAQVLSAAFHRDVSDLPGAGAAGGLGAGLMAFCSAQLSPGIEILFQMLHLEEQVAWADLILTGEGRVDATSLNGKLLSGVGALARQYQKPVVALTGSIGQGSASLLDAGISAVIPISDGPITLDESLARGPELISAAAERIARLLTIGGTILVSSASPLS
jgi:glycerate kinase